MDFVRAKGWVSRADRRGGFLSTLENGEQLRALNVVLCLGVGATSLPVQIVTREGGSATYHRPLLVAGIVIQNQGWGSHLYSGANSCPVDLLECACQPVVAARGV
ncbi:hypothetical protein AGR9A_Lc40436 [Agrobacterium salinitolerans str. Hayward 0363]|nr:hypothetical protein AGR9A_Lc40436 [Agrobacterium salinitolerans str. Hayward 0363]